MKSTCTQNGCVLNACFGFKADPIIGLPDQVLFCGRHRDVKSVYLGPLMCGHNGCTKAPTYGVTIGKPTRCGRHKLSNMFNVVHDTCRKHGCHRRASYAEKNEAPTHCIKHRTQDMCLVSSRVCQEADCRTKASFGRKNGKPMFCKAHSKGLQNVARKGYESTIPANLDPVLEPLQFYEAYQQQTIKLKEMKMLNEALESPEFMTFLENL